ncbi:MAG: hypothetical protein K2N74_03575 [Clostridiales bacterium]|nr:hypothetical protein [Clostridiales bacterium]
MKKLKRLAAAVVSVAMLTSVAMLSACSGVSYSYPDKVSVYETTGTKASLLGRKSSITFSKFEEEDYTRQTIYINTNETYQEYAGYGASMTHASAHLLMQADEETRENILNDLFSRDGANFSVVRLPVGASDYIAGNTYFTCDDLPEGQTDNALEHFNLDHDQEMIAVAKRIKEINPNVQFMASPWAAPAWMKQN